LAFDVARFFHIPPASVLDLTVVEFADYCTHASRIAEAERGDAE
jgi:hypothetical protein